MARTKHPLVPLMVALGLLAAPAVVAETPPNGDEKLVSGMSIVGNDEAPKSLVIVPWKSSALGDPLDLSRALEDGRQPVDREVFMRELNYYQIRTRVRAEGTR
jgi:hypothetical protein